MNLLISPIKPKEYLVFAIIWYSVAVSLIFTGFSLKTFTNLTPDGTRIEYRTCLEEGRDYDTGNPTCEAWSLNPTSYRSVGNELKDIFIRIVILIGLLWFPIVTYMYYEENKYNWKNKGRSREDLETLIKLLNEEKK